MTTAAGSAAREADDSWPMVEEAVFRLFDDAAAKAGGAHIAIGPQLAELGWSDIEDEYPTRASELLFRAQGRALAQTDCLDRVMLAELSPRTRRDARGIVLPSGFGRAVDASGGEAVDGLVLGPLDARASDRLAVPVFDPNGGVSIGLVAVDQLSGEQLDTFDPSLTWTRVRGVLEDPPVEASDEWALAWSAAHRALATELIALADAALALATDHVSVREQFGAPIGSFQAPRHLLADAAATVEGARALLAESWRYGGVRSARTVKAAAGRAHRAASDATMQVCGGIGMTAEHDLHRYVRRGFLIDTLCGATAELEAQLALELFDAGACGTALPGVTSWD